MQSILADRKTTSGSRNGIRTALVNYALYGEESVFRSTFDTAGLPALYPKELTGLIKGLRDYRHRLFYYGRNFSRLKAALEKFYRAPNPVKLPLPAKFYPVRPSTPAVYFVNYEGAQADVDVLNRGERFNKALLPVSNLFNRYLESLYFQEIRAARSLAYSGRAVHWMSDDTLNYNYTQLNAGTQANKVNELLKTYKALLRDISGKRSYFAAAKEDQLKRFQSERIKGPSVFWTYEALRRQGLYHDVRKDFYAAEQKMSFQTLLDFFARNIQGRDVVITIMGDKKDIDMKDLEQYGQVKEVDVRYLFNFR